MVIRLIFLAAILIAALFLLLSKVDHLAVIYNTPYGHLLRPMLTKRWASTLAGYYADSSLSRRHIASFIKNNGIDMQEAAEPVSSFKTFNEFFIRTLKKDARPINNDPNVLISPADSYVIGKQNISLHDRFPIKDSSFNLTECLGNEELAKEFDGGSLLMFRLAPWHYHRFHFPISCMPKPMKCIHGDYDSVNPQVYKRSIQPLETNERCLIQLTNTPCSTMFLIPVGALFVGAITATYTPDKIAHKGDEAGYFSFGGSTILLLAKKGCIEIDTEILENSAQAQETSIKFGQKIGVIKSPLIAEAQ